MNTTQQVLKMLICITVSVLSGCTSIVSAPPETLVPLETDTVKTTISRGKKSATYTDPDLEISIFPAGPIDNHYMFGVVLYNKSDFILLFRESGLKLEWSNDNRDWFDGKLLSAEAMDKEWKYKWYFNGEYYAVIKRERILFDNDIAKRSVYTGFIEIDPDGGLPQVFPRFVRVVVAIGSRSESFIFENVEYMDPQG
jgi:hypothetical protein